MVRDTVILGYVADNDLQELYAQSAVFLFPTLYEGFGLPALEAMAAGLPVVGSHTSSIPEVVGDAGVLFDPLSIEAGAKAVLSVLDDDAAQRSLSVAGVERARRFTWEHTGKATVEGYKRAHALLAKSDVTTRAHLSTGASSSVEAKGACV
jgi:glycosyltransferase involved in cell wall biosynthesis